MANKVKSILIAAIACLSLPTITSCELVTDYTITILNWEDYIATGEDEDGELVDTSVVEEFKSYFYEKYGKTIRVNYETFSTNEDLYNQLNLGALTADLVCPSDYMIQKMIKADMLEVFPNQDGVYSSLPNYNDYGSPFIKSLFAENDWLDYSIPYMWGTMGFTYNPTFSENILEDIKSWEIQWDTSYKGKITVKDSVRDTYFTAVLHVYKEELEGYRTRYENNEITADEYNELLTEVFNRCDDETLELVEDALIELKSNIHGLEVDDGKNDIVTGQIAINLAWSGDSVFSMDSAEEAEVYLNYEIPQEGSNIWFDGWVMPKGAQVDLACEFLNFICNPEIAALNMNFTGYTSAIAGQEIWDLVNDWYASEEGEEVDLSYFFEGTLNEGVEAKIIVEERGRQFDAQYPDKETVTRCAIMKDFGDQTEKVYQMWNNFKAAL